MLPLLQELAVSDILAERRRQDAKFGKDQQPTHGWLRVLTEEFLEAVRAQEEPTSLHLREELVQVAAVALAWIQSLDRAAKPVDPEGKI